MADQKECFKITKHIERGLLHNIYVAIFAGLLLIIAATAWGSDAIKKKEIRVFIEQQVLVASENGEEICSFDIVTGRDEKETTTGRYKIFRKHKKYTSKTYGSEMPYTILGFMQIALYIIGMAFLFHGSSSGYFGAEKISKKVER